MFHTLEVVRLMEKRGIAVQPKVEVRNVGTYATRECGIGGASFGGKYSASAAAVTAR